MDVRVERDSLGVKEIPANAYYGVQSLRAKENFPITGYKMDLSLIQAIGYIKKSAALVNNELGLLDEKRANVIVLAAEEMIRGLFNDQFIVDPIQGGAGTSFNLNANEVIANRALELLGEEKGNYHIISPNTHVNMSQSTNDVFPTAVNIACLKLSHRLTKELTLLVEAMKAKADEFDSIVKMGRTHLQDAVPIRLGQEFHAYYSVLKRDLARILYSLNGLYSINIGATSVGTGLNASEEYRQKIVTYLSRFTELDLVSAEDLVDATQNTDVYTDLSSSLKIAAVNLSKIASDLRLMNSGPITGIKEINLPAVQSGSSIMPGKVNPVICEVVNQIAYHVIGNDTTIAIASENGQLELNVMKPVLVYNIIQSITMLTNGIRVFREKAILGITANKVHCRNLVESSIGLVTAISPYIGYEKATEIAKEALQTKRSIREICLEWDVLTKEKLEQILDVEKMTYPNLTETGKEGITR